MVRDLDEDLIEATIRRVAASKAARLPDAVAESAVDDADVPPDLHVVPRAGDSEDLIAATIRRVAASKAARLPDAVAESASDGADTPPDLHVVPSAGDSEDLIAATIRRVAASKAARLPDVVAEGTADDPDATPSAQGEDVIEATIRRVAASQAARSPDAPAEDPVDVADVSPELHVAAPGDEEAREVPTTERPPADESLIEATLRRIEAEQAERTVEREREETLPPAPPPERRPTRDLQLVDVAPLSEAESDAAASTSSSGDVAALRRDLDETRQQLRELTARVDRLLEARPDQSRASKRPLVQPESPAAASSGASEDDWDDAPRITRMDVGLPPRPAIVREPSPPEMTPPRRDAPEPTPAPASIVRASAPTDAAEPKRGFDLLPRTYRITVEDKRRGVDLVPLHRALLGMDGVRDMSLLSYSNGTAIVALEATTEIAPDALGAAVSRAMAREVKVEVHNEQTMVIKLAED